jgi:DNA polymerase III subunit gamma/tau
MSEVLALKYRPKRFEDLIGQSTISQTLSLALDTKRLSHAYLLSGLRGSGKTSTARILAKSFLCDDGPTSNPCEVCNNCKSANEGKHLDIIEMDAASNRGIDDIKELIEHIKYKPSSARFKIFIIDEIHMLTTQAFNALLKTLEEPPKFVKFILATTDPLKLPATILSRTQHFRFNKIPHKNVVQHLAHILNIENIKFENDALDILSRSGQGSLRDTLTMLDQAIIFAKGEVTVSAVVDMLGLLDPKVLDNIFNIIIKKEDISNIISLLENFEASLIIDEMTRYLKELMLKKDIRFDVLIFDRYFRILSDAKHLLHLNSDNEFVILLTLLKMQEAVNLKSIDDIINEVEKLETQEKIVSNTNLISSNKSENYNINHNDLVKEKEKENIIIKEEVLDYNINYKKIITKLYKENSELGKCFEENFIFKSFENNILLIESSASGECKKILWKNFPAIRIICEEFFEDNIDIDFKKVKVKEKEKVLEQKNVNENILPEQQFIEQPFIEEVANYGSSCIENTIASPINTMTDSQHEYEIEDIEHSNMFKNVKELFKPTKIVVTSKA